MPPEESKNFCDRSRLKRSTIWKCFICGDQIDFREIPNPEHQRDIMIQHYCEDCEMPNPKPRLTATDIIMLRGMKVGL